MPTNEESPKNIKEVPNGDHRLDNINENISAEPFQLTKVHEAPNVCSNSFQYMKLPIYAVMVIQLIVVTTFILQLPHTHFYSFLLFPPHSSRKTISGK